MLPELPTTPAEVYDQLQQYFGVGTYDEATATEPWYRARAIEIAKIKALMKRRQITPEQFGKTIWYARREGLSIHSAADVLKTYSTAIRQWNISVAQAARERALSQRDDVIAEALEAGDDEFVQRLLRADEISTESLVAEWRAR